MDAFRIVTVVALFLSYGGLSNQLFEEDKEDVEEIIESITTTTTGTSTTVENATFEVTNATTTVFEISNCTTGKGDPGACVKRISCEHGTPAIDFTLYAPRGYINKCESDEVCCPPNAQLSLEHTKTREYEFDFDDDDD